MFFGDHVQIVTKATSIFGLLKGHFYVKKTLMEEFYLNLSVENIYFPHNDCLRIVIDKNAVHFHTIP